MNQYSVTGTDGGKLEVFSLAEGRSLSSAPAHTNAVTALSVSEDEAQTLLVSGSEDGIIKVYQVQRYSARLMSPAEIDSTQKLQVH